MAAAAWPRISAKSRYWTVTWVPPANALKASGRSTLDAAQRQACQGQQEYRHAQRLVQGEDVALAAEQAGEEVGAVGQGDDQQDRDGAEPVQGDL